MLKHVRHVAEHDPVLLQVVVGEVVGEVVGLLQVVVAVRYADCQQKDAEVQFHIMVH